SFRRSEHLRRHLACHSSSRPFKCQACHSGFKRRDVLRKHLRGCSLRVHREVAMPEPLPVGKKATSCDQCAQTKKRCDRKFPCSSCTTKHFVCTYERQTSAANQTPAIAEEAPHPSIEDEDYSSDLEVNYDFADDLDSSVQFSLPNFPDAEWLDLDWNAPFTFQVPKDITIHSEPRSRDLGHNQLQLSCNPQYLLHSTTKPQPSFDFLLNFTQKSSTGGIKSVFNYKRCRLPRTSTCHVFQDSSRHHGASPENLMSGLQDSYQPGCTSSQSAMSLYRDQNRVSPISLIESLDDPMFVQSKAIWDSFRVSRIRSAQIALQPVYDPDRADERCLHFFRPEHLRKFTRLFWDEWYPHCPILHKPTFDVLSAPVLLLVPMTIIGACMSPKDDEVALAKEWLEFAEELVFSSALLSAEPVERTASVADAPPLRIIQAAYITCIMLNWEGSDTMKRRVRHHHFAAVVSAVREIGLATSNHYPLDFVDANNFSWHEFVKREETIRTFTYVFLLDTAFVIFNNTPPRMVLHEMNLEMPASESCFQAGNASDCYNHWHAHVSHQFAIPGSMPLLQGEAISILMRDNYDEHSLRFANLSILSLFTLVAGLHTVVFQQRSLFTCLPTSLVPVRSALARWQALWPMRSDSVDQTVERESWQDTGFIGQAQEYAWLVLARLDKLEAPAETIPATAREQSPLAESDSGHLDDTSMTLITDLMLSLTVAGG
ncbi:hypothetical protein L207DRAFT_608000, partial [Hyaloscypha variabilis F]